MKSIENVAYGNVKYWTLITSLFTIASGLFYFGYQVAKIVFYLGKVTAEHQQILEILRICK